MQKKILRIYQITEGYCYNSDSLFLWDFALSHLHRKQRVLEIGSGSGVIGLLCKREKDIDLYQLEKQTEYALLNLKNATINNLTTQIFNADCLNLLESQDFLHTLADSLLTSNKIQHISTSLCQAISAKNNTMRHRPNNDVTLTSTSFYTKSLIHVSNINHNFLQSFDIILSNPPFYAKETLTSQNPLKAIARQSSFLPLESFILFAKKLLKPNAKLIFCYSPFVLSEILSLLHAYHFSIESLRFVYPRIHKNSCLVLVCAKMNSKTQTAILPPLITHIGQNQTDNSKEVQEIYQQAKTYSIKIKYEDIAWNYLFD